MPAVMTLVLCIFFIADVFPWLHFQRFQSTKVRQFCNSASDSELMEEVLDLLSVML